MIHHEICRSLAASKLDLIADAPATAVLPGSGRALAQRRLLKQHRIVRFQNLEWLRLGERNGGARVCVPVTGPVAAVAAAAEVIHHVVALMLRIVAAEAEVAGSAERSRVGALRLSSSERAEHRLDHALRALSGGAGDRLRILGVQKRPPCLADVNWREAAGVQHDVGKDVAYANVDGRLRRRERRVHRTAARWAALREIEMEIRPLHFER